MKKQLNRLLLAGATALATLSSSQVMALDGASLYKTKTCIACHGPEGRKPIQPNYPRLAGQNKAYLLQQMKDIKSGARNNGNTAAMKGVMHLVNDQEMEAIADYLSKLKP